MTDLDHARPGTDRSVPVADPVAVRRAVAAAEAAAAAAPVRVREVRDIAELEKIGRLYDEIWRPGNNPPISVELLRAFAKAGNYVAAAFAGPALVGACVGFFTAPADDAIHSHIAGVSASMRGRNVGFALKLHQRAWAMTRGVSAVAWTFDPLVGRNAYFNLAKLAAAPVEYLPNFYGDMGDGINSGDDSDRLLVRWDLGAAATVDACAGVPRQTDARSERRRGARVALDATAGFGRVAGRDDSGTVLVAVPRDIEQLRSADPAGARQWRRALRDTLGALLADGATVTGFDRAGWYVVRRPSEGVTS